MSIKDMKTLKSVAMSGKEKTEVLILAINKYYIEEIIIEIFFQGAKIFLCRLLEEFIIVYQIVYF